MRRIALADDGNGLQGLLDGGEIGRCEHHVGRADVLLKAVQLGGARNRHDPGLLRQQPGDGDLRPAHALRRGECAQHLHQPGVGLAVLRAEARHDVAEVALVEGGVGVDGSGQKPPAQRAEGYETDAQFLQHRQHALLGLAPPQRVFTLQRRHRLHRVGAADRLRPGLGQAEVSHLAFGNQIAHGTGHIFNRHVRIDPVLIEQVDAVGLETLERGFGHRANVRWAAVQALAHHAVGEAELGGNHHLIAERRHRFAQKLFVDERSVDFSAVEKGDAALVGGADQADAVALLGCRPVAVAQAHAAQSDGRDLQAAAAQCTCLHDVVLG